MEKSDGMECREMHWLLQLLGLYPFLRVMSQALLFPAFALIFLTATDPIHPSIHSLELA